MSWDSVGPIRAGAGATLGEPLIQTSLPGLPVPEPAGPIAEVHYVLDERMSREIAASLAQIEARMHTLEARTLEGRCRRFWTWLTRLVRW